jgi:hypothetical protein
MTINDKPLLTVVLPISKMYGRMEKFENTIKNLSDFHSIELRVVHDIQDEFTSVDINRILQENPNPRIKFHQGHFGSAALARNFGMYQIDSDWLMFWDSDDDPHVSEIYNYLNNCKGEDCDLFIGSFTLKRNSGAYSERKPKNNYLGFGLNPGIWRCIFRVSKLHDLKFRNYKVAEDQLFILDFLAVSECLKFSPQNFYSYFVGDQNQTTGNLENLSELHLAAVDTLKMFSRVTKKFKFLVIIMFVRQAITYLTRYSGISFARKATNLFKAILN